VEIYGYTPRQISDMTIQVFKENHFMVAFSGPTRLQFEKKGSTMDNVAYGNWLEAPIWIRVKVSIENIGEAKFRLRSEAFYLRDRGATTEEQINASSGPYDKMLNEVASRLRTTPPSGP
jgi:hypothetical protein